MEQMKLIGTFQEMMTMKKTNKKMKFVKIESDGEIITLIYKDELDLGRSAFFQGEIHAVKRLSNQYRFIPREFKKAGRPRKNKDKK